MNPPLVTYPYTTPESALIASAVLAFFPLPGQLPPSRDSFLALMRSLSEHFRGALLVLISPSVHIGGHQYLI